MHHIAGPYLYQYEYLFKGLLLWSPKKDTRQHICCISVLSTSHERGGERRRERERERERGSE